MPNLSRTFRNSFRFLSKSANSEDKSVVLYFELGILMMIYGENLWEILRIHLTGAATNPWIRFEYDDSFVKFEIGTN